VKSSRLLVVVTVLTWLLSSASAEGQTRHSTGHVIEGPAGSSPGVASTAYTFQTSHDSHGHEDATSPHPQNGDSSGLSHSGPAVPVAVDPVTCVPVYLPVGGAQAGVGFTADTSSACALDFGPPKKNKKQGKGPSLPSPEQLAQIASDHAVALATDPRLAMAPGRIGLTGLPTFVWLAPRPHAVAASAGVPGLTVTAEARPVQYTWNFGDGRDLVTSSPGRAWKPGREGNVSHTYETKGRYEMRVEVVWEARWRAASGPWHDLGYFSNRGSASYRVRQVVPVLVPPQG
jgi:hypothetical protein